MSSNFLICAAGLGTRMKAIHPSRPKPMLKLNGKTLLEHSLDSLTLNHEDVVIIITLENCLPTDFKSFVRNQLLKKCQRVEFLEISQPTRGQLETAVLSQHLWTPGRGVAIFNCDSSFSSSKLNQAILDEHWAGIIPCSKEPGDSWSFCKVTGEPDLNSTFHVSEIAEKKRISDWCSVGFYYFRDPQLFLDLAALEMKSSTSSKELYVAPLYERYLKIGLKIGMHSLDSFKAMGSIAQLEQYWHKSLTEMQSENF